MVTFNRCGHEYIAHCPSVALSDEEDATCSEHAIPGELDALRARLSAAERERDSAFARGVEAAAKVCDHWASVANAGEGEHVWLRAADRIRALSPAADAGKETT